MPRNWFIGSALLAVAMGCRSAPAFGHVQVFPLRDTAGLIAPTVRAESVQYQGRKAVRITIDGEDHDGLALLPGTDFQDGTIEADVAVRATTPPGVRNPGFAGIAFRVGADAGHFEYFYLRPGNSGAADQAMRNHSVQYGAAPGFGWYRLRREWPSAYESNAALEPGAWTKMKIEVAGRSAKLYLNGSPKPILVVEGLKGENLHGAVGLWSYTDEEAYFSNVRITPAAARSVANGSEVTGSWEMHISTDAIGMDASLDLRREGNQVAGTWSGPLGEDRAVTGTWRNGYVELTFGCEWPKDYPRGAPGPVEAFLAGWIDGDTGSGRMRIAGRADGTWTAKRKL